MPIEISDPRLMEFLNEQVRLGHFASVSEAIEASVAQMMLDHEVVKLDAKTLAELDEAEAQIERGEGIPWEEAKARLRMEIPGLSESSRHSRA